MGVKKPVGRRVSRRLTLARRDGRPIPTRVWHCCRIRGRVAAQVACSADLQPDRHSGALAKRSHLNSFSHVGAGIVQAISQVVQGARAGARRHAGAVLRVPHRRSLV